MMSRYREVAEIVLRYLEHRDRLVRLSITSLLPRIAHFLRDRFVTNYLTVCQIPFIIKSLVGRMYRVKSVSLIYCLSPNYVRKCYFSQICMNHILAVLGIPAERSSGFIALGEMAGALDGELVHYLPTITLHLRDAVCQLYCSWSTT